MDILERDHCFDQLSEFLRLATTGNGRTVLISGEAGIGKTALVEQFVSQHGSEVSTAMGSVRSVIYPTPAWTTLRYCGPDSRQPIQAHRSQRGVSSIVLRLS